jgi:tetratricopeptide (TPR) repeat protein
VFSWSYQALTAGAARLFRLFGLQQGPDVAIATAASLGGIPIRAAQHLLSELVRASLINEHTPGRYTCHDLLRSYALELAASCDAAEDRHAAVTRLLDHYLTATNTAASLLEPHQDELTLAGIKPGVTSQELTHRQQARDWLTAEHATLLAAIEHAHQAGFDAHAFHIAWNLLDYFNWQGHWHDWIATHQTALRAALRSDDPAAQAHTHRNLALAYTRIGRYAAADAHYHHAFDLFSKINSEVGQAHTHLDASGAYGLRHLREQALSHAKQAADRYQSASHQIGYGRALNAVGWCHSRLGRHRQALTYCHSALTLQIQTGDAYGQSCTWNSLGHAHHQLGQHADAKACYQQALTLHRKIGDRYLESETLGYLGDAHHDAGHPDTARTHWQQALAILDELDHGDANHVRTKLATTSCQVEDRGMLEALRI